MKIHFIMAIGISSLISSTANALTPAEVFAKVSPSVWGITTYDKDGLKLGSGSAVVVAPETLITNCHVLRKAARISVTSENVAIGATLEMWDTVRDICQVKAKNMTAPALKIGSSNSLQVGQTVFSIGNPLGLELSLGAGLVSSLRKNDQSQLETIQTSTPISSGSSGGGLFDEQARLVGITTFQAKDGQNLNFAIPVEWIKELPTRHAAARTKDDLDRSVLEVKKAAAPSAQPKTWRYQFSDSRSRRKEISFIERDLGNGNIGEEAVVEGNSSPALQWQPNSPIFRMRSAAGIEWVEVSPKLFESGSQNRNLRGLSLLGGSFNVTVRYLGEEQVSIGGKAYSASKIELRGLSEQNPIAWAVNTFTIKAWYSKELSRVIKTNYVTAPVVASMIYDKNEMTLISGPQNDN